VKRQTALACLAVSLLALGLGVFIILSPVFPLTKPFDPWEWVGLPDTLTGEDEFENRLEPPPEIPETFQPEAENLTIAAEEQPVVNMQKSTGEPQPQIPPSTTGEVYHTVTMCVSPSGAGTVYPPEGSHRVKEGALTIQVMSVKSGYAFEKWVITVEGTTVDGGSAMFKTVQVVNDMTITAVFRKVETVSSDVSAVVYGSVVVDFAFYDKITIAPTGTVTCLETGVKKSLTPVEITPNEWHGQCKFTGLEVGKTYTFSYTLTNGCKLSGTFSITVKRSVEYYHQGFPYGAGASIIGFLASVFNMDPKQAKEVGGVLALASAPIVVASALAYVRKR